MLNYDKHKEEIDKIFKHGKSLCEVNQKFLKTSCWGCSSDKEMKANCKIKTLEWLCQEHIEPILSDEAKAYLKTIIEPIECTNISKNLQSSYTYELRIYYKDGYILIVYSKDTKLNEYFKNMVAYKKYTPKELGL